MEPADPPARTPTDRTAHISRRSVRYAIYYLLILGIYVMHAQQQTFIYFQF